MNDTIFFFFYNFAHYSSFLDALIVFFAVYFPFVVGFLALIFLLFYKKWKGIVLGFISSFLAYFLSVVLKFFFHTIRPYLALPNVHALFNESGYAFPSGHASFFMALAVSLFFYNKKVGLPVQAGYIFMLFTLLIGLARIIAGVHFPVDILGGFALGALVAYFIRRYYY